MGDCGLENKIKRKAFDISRARVRVPWLRKLSWWWSWIEDGFDAWVRGAAVARLAGVITVARRFWGVWSIAHASYGSISGTAMIEAYRITVYSEAGSIFPSGACNCCPWRISLEVAKRVEKSGPFLGHCRTGCTEKGMQLQIICSCASGLISDIGGLEKLQTLRQLMMSFEDILYHDIWCTICSLRFKRV